jgi:hypothetical protein
MILGIVGPQWEQQIVAELDSSLNKWIDSVPDHRTCVLLDSFPPTQPPLVRWDPHRENLLFFNQSASLFTHYYHLQILIHRPFISSPSKPSSLTFPSLAICTNAARSCCHVVDIQSQRGTLPLGHIQVGFDRANLFSDYLILTLDFVYVVGGIRIGHCVAAQYLGRQTSGHLDGCEEGNGRCTQMHAVLQICGRTVIKRCKELSCI